MEGWKTAEQEIVKLIRPMKGLLKGMDDSAIAWHIKMQDSLADVKIALDNLVNHGLLVVESGLYSVKRYPREIAFDRILNEIWNKRGFPAGMNLQAIAGQVEMADYYLDDVQVALNKLRDRGFLVERDGAYYVAPLENLEVVRYLDLRESLEIYFSRRLVQRLIANEDEDDELLRDLIEAQISTNNAVHDSNRDDFRNACRNFHRSLANAALSRLAGDFADALWQFAWRVYNEHNEQSLSNKHMQEIKSEHAEILNKIKGRGESGAVQAIRAHYLGIRRRAGPKSAWRGSERALKSRYEIILYWSNKEGAFIAEVPELKDCAASGATYSEAAQNAEAVIHEWIETARKEGLRIPEPKGRLGFA